MKKMTLFFTLFVSLSAFATKFEVVYRFQGGNDGNAPFAGLAVGLDGDLYGTTRWGGTDNDGTVFKVSPGGQETILYNFTGQADGANSWNNLVMDSQGNFYGSTITSSSGMGTLFEITPQGNFTTLYTFQGPPNDVTYAYGPLAMDSEGNLYGVGPGGASTNCISEIGEDCGAVFMLTPGGQESILYNFTGFPDGMDPEGPLVLESGVLYGTTPNGGDQSCESGFGCGILYALDLSTDTETIVHTFEGSDGSIPQGLVADAKGHLYGGASGGAGGGVVFEFVDGKKGWTESILRNFGEGGDVEDPRGGLLLVPGGDIYLASLGARKAGERGGAVVKLTRSGSDTILHGFSQAGEYAGPPNYGVVSENGWLYGTTRGTLCQGGIDYCGIVFRVKP